MDSRMKVEQILPAGQSQVPAFLLKLRNLLDDRDNDNLIAWDAVGCLVIWLLDYALSCSLADAGTSIFMKELFPSNLVYTPNLGSCVC